MTAHFETGTLTLPQGPVPDINFQFDFTPVWAWVNTDSPAHCGGAEVDQILWSLEGNTLTMAGQINSTTCTVKWLVLGGGKHE